MAKVPEMSDLPELYQFTPACAPVLHAVPAYSHADGVYG